mgnify:FL=1
MISAGASHMSVHALMLIFPSLIPVLKNQFNVGYDTLGLVVTFSSFLFGLGAIPAGWYENKFGGRQLLLLYLLGSSLSSIFIFFSNSFIQIVFGLCFLGLFSSIYHPSGLTLISRRISNVTKGMAIHGVFGNIGLSLGPVLAAFFISAISWRFAYLFLAILNLSILIFTFFSIPYIPRNNNIITNFNINKPQNNSNILILFFMVTALLGMNYYGFTTFMPTYLAENTNRIFIDILPEVKAGIFPSLIFLSGVMGSLLGVKISIFFGKIKALIFIISMLIPILFAMAFASNYSLLVFSILWAIFFASQLPIANTLIADFTDDSKRGVGFGINFFISFGVGSIAAYLSGLIAEKMDIYYIFIAMGLLLLPAVIFSWKIHKISQKY